jgi:ribosomal silencing factor RsfS
LTRDREEREARNAVKLHIKQQKELENEIKIERLESHRQINALQEAIRKEQEEKVRRDADRQRL